MQALDLAVYHFRTHEAERLNRRARYASTMLVERKRAAINTSGALQRFGASYDG
ncbi:hypothetical protein G9X64_20175 [Rhizobium sophorae]|uniref:Uncharacterized protein n=1 Tax=Rhizobium sophorae TaxID=1535242 RepID=A0A7Y3S7Y7_9HYPH|nr:hypothetical protein [Rhizobium sophorae]MBX4863200.1 hypothetical protein [Rhizobium bangladeshense]NNU38754.1 hypothetical protein [Rhizobium sophorae]